MKDLKREKLGDLIDQCRTQTDLYIRQESSDSRYCFEIWRRAIVEKDEVAWNAVIQQYNGFVRRWLSLKLSRHPYLQFEEEALANGVFINFFRFVGPEKFDTFQNLAGVLQYLKMCCATIVADAMRDYQARTLDVSLDFSASSEDSSDGGLSYADRLKSDDDLEGTIQVKADRSVFWRTIWDNLPDPTDRALVYLRYILDMPPREISQQFPHYFPDVQQVYRRNKNLLWRLRNNPEFSQEVGAVFS